jgi:hypothetical protein
MPSGEIIEGSWKNNSFNGIGTIKYNENYIISYYGKFCDQNNVALIIKDNNYYVQITKNFVFLKALKLPVQIKTLDELKIFFANFNVDTKDLTMEEIENIKCPISISIMFDSVITSCNHTFSQKTIQKCPECPLCRQMIKFYIPNDYILNIIKKLKFRYNDKDFDISEIENLENIKEELEEIGFLERKRISLDASLNNKITKKEQTSDSEESSDEISYSNKDKVENKENNEDSRINSSPINTQLSGYFLFARTYREKILKNNQHVNIENIPEMLGEIWSKMTDEEKDKYRTH